MYLLSLVICLTPLVFPFIVPPFLAPLFTKETPQMLLRIGMLLGIVMILIYGLLFFYLFKFLIG